LVLVLVLHGPVLCCETWSCYARLHNDLEGHSNFSSTIYSFSILCLEHHYCEDQQWRSLTWNFRQVPLFSLMSWSCYFGLGLKNLVSFTSLAVEPQSGGLRPGNDRVETRGLINTRDQDQDFRLQDQVKTNSRDQDLSHENDFT